MKIIKAIWLVTVTLLFSSCGRGDHVTGKPTVASLVGVWRLHAIEESLKSRLGAEFWANRDGVTINLQKDGTAVLSAFPAFKGNERNVPTFISGSVQWRLIPLERRGDSLLWQVLLIAKKEGIGVPLLLKKRGDKYVLDYMTDPEVPTGIQFILVNAPEQKKK